MAQKMFSKWKQWLEVFAIAALWVLWLILARLSTKPQIKLPYYHRIFLKKSNGPVDYYFNNDCCSS
jgi:ABC-type nitrate/sulfonate/bicarbonate transport system permease component